jgi:ubiquinone/menaquinone biosynthesis C-methylase UbiE
MGVELIRKGETAGGRPDAGPINDGAFWDSYVMKWGAAQEHEGLARVGNEWKNEEIFLSLLGKYASAEHNALEIGCGGGRMTQKAVHHFKHVYAADVSKEMIRRNAESIGAANVSYHNLDGFRFAEFASSSMDCVFSHDVFVHFSSLQVYPYFKEIKRVLKKGGVALVSFYNFEVHFGDFKEMTVQYNRQRIFPPHMRVHFVTEEMLRLMLRDLGLEVCEIEKRNYLIVVFRK